MPKKVYGEAEEVQEIANRLIPTYHPELSTARIRYVYVSEASSKNGRPVYGVAKKISGVNEYLIEQDFVIVVALNEWNNMDNRKRAALIDHLLESCTGEEDEKTADMKWTTRTPEVQEFTSILHRHGAWTEDLIGMVEVASRLNLESRAQEVVDTVTQTSL